MPVLYPRDNDWAVVEIGVTINQAIQAGIELSRERNGRPQILSFDGVVKVEVSADSDPAVVRQQYDEAFRASLK